MKILHTSDWHLGRTLHGVDLHPYQVEFHDWLVETVREHAVDAVVIPGDVYDRAVPPVESVRLLSRTLARLADLTTVILTPGNHDSADRLGFGAGLMRGGVHILADAAGIEHPVVMADAHGEVLFFGLPYLEPDLHRHRLAAAGEEPLARSHEAVTKAAIERVRERIAAHPAEGGARPRSVLLTHTFIAGGEESDSERDLTVGGVDSVPPRVLSGFDYLALGHLHGCQDLSRQVDAAAWYSGSPLAFSFSEKDHRKSVLLVELGDPAEPARVERIAAPVPRRLTELSGPLEEVLARAEDHSEDWLKAIITDARRPEHLQDRLRAAYPHLLHTEYQPEGRAAADSAPIVRVEQDPLEVMGDFFAYVTGGPARETERAVFEDAYGEVRTRGQEAS